MYDSKNHTNIMKKLTDYLHESTIFYLATIKDNKPSIRPVGGKPGFDGDGFVELDGKIYFYTDNRKQMYTQMVDSPDIAMTFIVEGGFVRLFAKAVFDGNKEAKVAILNENPILKNLYNAEDEFFEVYYIKDVDATFYSPIQDPVKLD